MMKLCWESDSDEERDGGTEWKIRRKKKKRMEMEGEDIAMVISGCTVCVDLLPPS